MKTELEEAVQVLRDGQIVACPTETFVALVADVRNEEALKAVHRIKGRPDGMPIALLVPNLESAASLVDVCVEARALAAAHWPGALTLVGKAKGALSALLLREGTVGLRVPGPSPALDLVRAFGAPLTATSANQHGEPPCRRASELKIDGWAKEVAFRMKGLSPGGTPSTIVDVTGRPFKILRQGPIFLSTL